MEKFSLQHTVLYAKHWYKHSDNFWEDIKKCLTADGYSGEYFSPADCTNVIINHFERLNHPYYGQLSRVLFGIQETECWKYGYYTNHHTWIKDYEKRPIYNINEAIVRYCLSCFFNIETDKWNPCKPDFKNCLPARKGITKKKAEEFFGK